MKRLILTLLILTTMHCASDDPRTFVAPDSGGTDMNEIDTSADASDTSSTEDMSPDTEFDVSIDLDPNICQPNQDGVIERSELSFETGVNAKFRIATNVMFDTRGENGVWDMVQDFTGDVDDLIAFNDPAGAWWSDDFPTVTHFTPLSSTSDVLGVFQITDDALLLLGVVSPQDGFDATNLEYDPPVPVLQFPLEEGDQWSVDSDVSGTFNGVISFFDESYTFVVDSSGTVQTPFANFEALRVQSTLTRTVGLLETVVQSHAFVSECFGTIATVASQENESQTEFLDVAELRRITR